MHHSCPHGLRPRPPPARRHPVARIDTLLNATGCPTTDIAAIADRYPEAGGLRSLRHVLTFVDPGSESLQETRTRLLLIRAGLPRPTTQIEGCNVWGAVIARIDLGWPELLVGVEYDDAQHWTDPDQHDRDVKRLEFLAAQGGTIVRVSAQQLRHERSVVVERVRRALDGAGYLVA
jgi:hypothetical protein